MEPLSPVGCRALGSLLEKQLTVPATYPLTLNALVAACNQTTGRDPVLALSEAEVEAGADELRREGLVRLVHPSHGARMVKYRQVADEALGLDAGGRAVLTVLLLRGAQTPGELRSRGDRLHAFESTGELEASLERLAGRDQPLVAARPRQPGQKEARWVHLLGRPDESSPAERPSQEARSGPAPRVAPVEVPPEVAALAPFVGTWVGRGQGHYPTIASFSYTEEIELRPLPGKPMLAYRSATRAADDGRLLHGESGFLRLVGPDQVELVVAQGAGLVEIAEGLLDPDGPELLLVSRVMAGSSTAKQVDATERRYRVDGDRLSYELAMAAVGQPLQNHLRAELERR
jgi:uncharacterized protein YceH (UPF0502 family)